MKKNCTVRDLIIYLQALEAFDPNLLIAFTGENGAWTVKKGELDQMVRLTSNIDYLNDEPYISDEPIVILG